jgi:tripartite-type tricarboxylate transporter receptor subunit TctC
LYKISQPELRLHPFCSARADFREGLPLKPVRARTTQRFHLSDPRQRCRRRVHLATVAARALLAIAIAMEFWRVATLPILAQDYPTHTIKIMTNSGAGGTFDIFARALASELQKHWGAPVIVEPRPGGNFMIAGRACAEALPDGYTLCALSGETLVYSEFLYKNVPYNPRRDFAPVTNLFFNTQVLVANAALGAKTFDELLAVAKSKPLAFSAPAVPQRLFLERVCRQQGIEIVTIPFRGGGEAITAVLNGTTPILFSGGANFAPLIQEGTMVGLAVDSPQRSPLFPEVSTLSELGYSEKLNRNYLGLVVPAATQPTLVEQLNRKIVAIINDPAFRKQNLIERALEPIGDTSEHFARFTEDDRARFEKLVHDANIERQ